MVKKITALALSLTMMLSIGLTGCKKTNEGKDSTQPSQNKESTQKEIVSSEPVEISFWTMQLSPNFDDYLNGVINKFQEENKNITVKWLDVPWGDMEKKILAAAASNQMPDVANLNPHFAQQLAQFGVLADMETYAADVKTDYFTGAWQASKFDGKTFGLPWYLTTGVVFYNRDLFRKAGLDPEKAPKDFEELYTFSKAIKEKTGKFGFMTALSQQTAMEDFEKMGIRLFNDDYTKANFTSKEVIEGAMYFKRMIDEGLMPRESLTEGLGKAIQMYSAGEVAIFPGGTSHAGMIESNSAEVFANTGVGPQLLNNNGKINIAVMNITVSEKSPNKEAAVKFAKFITNAENQIAFAKVSGAIIPSTKDSIKDDFFTKPGSSAKDLARIVSAAQMENAQVIFPPIKNWNDVRTAFTEALQKVVSGQKAEEVFKAAEDAANEALAK